MPNMHKSSGDSMANILVAASPAPGHVNPMLVVAQHLSSIVLLTQPGECDLRMLRPACSETDFSQPR
jgi:hypothetical protein